MRKIRAVPEDQEEKNIMARYGCSTVTFSGNHDGLYDRHLLFDQVQDPHSVGRRDRFEAFAKAVRDVLAQRWVTTEETYAQVNPKRAYYLSMEYLLGRSLANNVANLMLEPVVRKAVEDEGIDWQELLEQEPDAGLGNGGLGRLAACFLDSMATLQLPAMGYGLRYEYGLFRQTIHNGWQEEHADRWLRHPDPWEVMRQRETVAIRLNASFKVKAGELRAAIGHPSILYGIPYDRPVIGYGGKTINTLRLWAAGAPEQFDLRPCRTRGFVCSPRRA